MNQPTEGELLHRMAAYCSTAERCRQDVEKKLAATDLSAEASARILLRLESEKFIDEARFCRSFVNDKLRFNHWGRVRIGYELRKKGIPPAPIREALDEIDEDEYKTILRALLKQKQKSVKGKSKHDTFRRLVSFAASRGFTLPEIMANLPAVGIDQTDDEAFIDNPD